MRDREFGRRPRPHPEFLRLDPAAQSDDREAGVVGDARRDGRETGPPGVLWVNAVDGMVWSGAPSRCRAVRGGMLCDEPGLGKTITVLALLLKTRGLFPGVVCGGFGMVLVC